MTVDIKAGRELLADVRKAEGDIAERDVAVWAAKRWFYENADELLAELEALRALAAAAEELSDGAALSFADERISYEEWQLGVEDMERLRAAIARLKEATQCE